MGADLSLVLHPCFSRATLATQIALLVELFGLGEAGRLFELNVVGCVSIIWGMEEDVYEKLIPLL